MDLDYRKLIETLETEDAAGPDAAEVAVAELLRGSGFYKRHKDPIVRLGAAAADARPEALAQRVLACARQRGAAYAAGALEAFFGVEQITTVTYAYVENIVVYEPIDLGSDVVALPEDRAPDQSFAEAIAKVRGKLSTRRGAIIAARQTKPPFLRAASKETGPSAFRNMSGGAPGETRIQIALKMITLCGPSSPAVRAMTTVVESDGLSLFEVPRGISYQYPGYRSGGLPVEITEEVHLLIPRYCALAPGDRRRIDTSISRLGLATARLEPSDAIVDLAIALEAILSDKGNKEELTYRLRLRAALILDPGLSERKRLKELVKSLYKERSAVVHGDVPNLSDMQLRKKGEQLVVRLIRKMLDLGGIPDWAVVELTGGQQIR